VLSGFDDYPIHQAAVPVAQTATSDINFYDRYFFNGYDRDGSSYFGVAMGLYPNRHLADAAFSVIHAVEQISLFTSQRAPADRPGARHVDPSMSTSQTDERCTVSVDSSEHGVRADLTFTARSARSKNRTTGGASGADHLRLHRSRSSAVGEGWIEIDGVRRDVSPARYGVARPFVGSAPPGSAPAVHRSAKHSSSGCGHRSTSHRCRPTSTSTNTATVAAGTRSAWSPADGSPPESMQRVDYRVEWRPGAVGAARFEYDLVDSQPSAHCRAGPATSSRCGLGYGHPEFGHGVWKGESIVASERIPLPVATPCSRQHIHVQAVCDATYVGPDGTTEHGLGILEQLAIGNHPTGLGGIFDPFVPQR
jgi:hypothetical protein